MSDTKRWKDETEAYGWQFVNELDEPSRWGVTVKSNGIDKCLYIYDKVACNTKLALKAPTYYDLFVAAQFAWNVHVMMKRGF